MALHLEYEKKSIKIQLNICEQMSENTLRILRLSVGDKVQSEEHSSLVIM